MPKLDQTPKEKRKLLTVYLDFWGKPGRRYWAVIDRKQLRFARLVEARRAAKRHGYRGVKVTMQGELL